MHLTRMRFGGIPPFTEPVDFSFDERVNVFVGANATGKSRLLSAIDECFNKKEDVRDWYEGSGGGIASLEPYPIDLLNLVLCQEAFTSGQLGEGKKRAMHRQGVG